VPVKDIDELHTLKGVDRLLAEISLRKQTMPSKRMKARAINAGYQRKHKQKVKKNGIN
jgi:hypothetical protein